MENKNQTSIEKGILTAGRYTAMVAWLIERGQLGTIELAPPDLATIAPEVLEAMIAAFQRVAGLESDGAFGPNTRNAFDRLVGARAAILIDVRALLASGKEKQAVTFGYQNGITDENQLTNEVFFARYPELGRQPLRSNQAALASEWKKIRKNTVRRIIAAQPRDGAGQPSAPASPETLPIRKHKKRGFVGYGGGRVDEVLLGLEAEGKLTASADDIEMLQRMANVESAGQIQGINSFDDVFMSAGFLQWPVLFHNPIGKLQRWIQRAPEGFARYGIELDEGRTWTFKRGSSKYTSVAIRGAKKAENLRTRAWAERFFRSGLDPDVIVAEVDMALIVIDEAKARIVKRCGDGFLEFYDQSPVLRALIQETFNNRPAYLRQALKRAMARAEKEGTSDAERFREILGQHIMAVYSEKGRARAGQNMVNKTGTLKL